MTGELNVIKYCRTIKRSIHCVREDNHRNRRRQLKLETLMPLTEIPKGKSASQRNNIYERESYVFYKCCKV